MQCQFFFRSDTPKIFEKVVIHINGYTGDFKNTVCGSKPSWWNLCAMFVVFLSIIFILNANGRGPFEVSSFEFYFVTNTATLN